MFDADKVGQALRFLRLGGARPVRGGQGRVPARVAAAAEDAESQCPRFDSRLVRPTVAGAEQSRSRRRSPTPSRACTCPTGPSMRTFTRTGPPTQATTTTSAADKQRERRVRWTTGVRRTHSLLRRRTGVRVDRRGRPHVAPGRTVPDDGTRAVRRRLPRRVDRRALPDRSGLGRRALPAGDEREASRDVRRAGARRHAPGPAGGRRLHRPDVQTHARAGVAA